MPTQLTLPRQKFDNFKFLPSLFYLFSLAVLLVALASVSEMSYAHSEVVASLAEETQPAEITTASSANQKTAANEQSPASSISSINAYTPNIGTSPLLSTGQLATQVFLGLVLVLVLIFSLAWLAKKTQLLPTQLQNQGAIRQLTSLQLGPKERLVLVEVGQEQLLLGISHQQIRLLHKLNTPVTLPEQENKPVFAHFLQEWLNKKQTRDSNEPSASPPSTSKEICANEAK